MEHNLPTNVGLDLTQVTFDPTDPKLKHLLANRERMHAMISAATDGSARPLWRLDGDRLYILSDKLDRDRLAVRMGGGVIIRSAEYGKLLSRITEGTDLRFIIDANTVVTRKGRRTPLTDSTAQGEWLTKRLENAGADVNQLNAGRNDVLIFSKPNRTKVVLQATTLSGFLTVTDEKAFKNTLTKGIGHGRAYGLGLLMVA